MNNSSTATEEHAREQQKNNPLRTNAELIP